MVSAALVEFLLVGEERRVSREASPEPSDAGGDRQEAAGVADELPVSLFIHSTVYNSTIT